MKEFEENKNLKNLIQQINLESPGSAFSQKVMNKVFDIQPAIEKIKAERILGKRFWLVISLFVILLLIMILYSGSDTANGSQINMLFSEIDTVAANKIYNGFFDRISSLPLSIAGILIGSSLLIFIDHFLFAKRKVRT